MAPTMERPKLIGKPGHLFDALDLPVNVYPPPSVPAGENKRAVRAGM
jgi:hypothetical protein